MAGERLSEDFNSQWLDFELNHEELEKPTILRNIRHLPTLGHLAFGRIFKADFDVSDIESTEPRRFERQNYL